MPAASRVLWLVALCCLAVALAHPLPARAIPEPEQVQQILNQRIKDGPNKGLVVGILTPEGERYFAAGAFGVADELTPPEKIIFEIGSITKTFTGVLLAEGIRRGEVKLSDTILAIWPVLFKSPFLHKITLQDLATHSAGLPAMPSNLNPAQEGDPYADYALEDLTQYLLEDMSAGAMRGVHQYSNLGMGLLGALLAKKAMTPYPELVQKRICEPLGLRDTSTVVPKDALQRLAQGHNAGGKPTPYWRFAALAGCGALHSTARDLLRYMSAYLDKLKDAPPGLLESLKQAITPVTTASSQDLKIGLGWYIIEAPEKTVLFHDGGTGGFRSFAAFIKESGVAVAVLSNTGADVSDIGFHLLFPQFPLREKRAPVPVPRETLEKYAGEYEVLSGTFIPAGTRIQLQATGKGLTYIYNGQAPEQVLPMSETLFYFPELWDAFVEMRMDEDGRVTGLTLKAGAQEIPVRRLEREKTE